MINRIGTLREANKGEKLWTSGSIKIGRKFGLKLLAEKHNRNYGLELEEILEKAGVPYLSEKQFEAKMAQQKVNK